jgi:hypothetical protein
MDNKEQLIEDLLDTPEDAAATAQTEKDMLPPVGSYVTVPALTMTYKIADQGANAGRFTARFFGEARQSKKVVDKETGNEKELSVSARFGFGLSHVRVNWPDSNEPDTNTKLYIQARRAYVEAYGNEPETPRNVYEFVRDYPVVLRVIHKGIPTEKNPDPKGEPRADVIAISAVRES